MRSIWTCWCKTNKNLYIKTLYLKNLRFPYLNFVQVSVSSWQSKQYGDTWKEFVLCCTEGWNQVTDSSITSEGLKVIWAIIVWITDRFIALVKRQLPNTQKWNQAFHWQQSQQNSWLCKLDILPANWKCVRVVARKIKVTGRLFRQT